MIKDNSDLHGKYCVNEQIKSDTVYVVDQDGRNVGEISRGQALMMAENASLDLVQVGEKDSIPVTKIMDFGKFLYSKKKQLGESKKNQKIIQIKEIKLRPNIGDQDYLTKLKQAEQFFLEGKRVKFTLQFKGREITRMNEVGPQIFARITLYLQEKGLGNILEEKDQRGGAFWSKIYSLKESSK